MSIQSNLNQVWSLAGLVSAQKFHENVAIGKATKAYTAAEKEATPYLNKTASVAEKRVELTEKAEKELTDEELLSRIEKTGAHEQIKAEEEAAPYLKAKEEAAQKLYDISPSATNLERLREAKRENKQSALTIEDEYEEIAKENKRLAAARKAEEDRKAAAELESQRIRNLILSPGEGPSTQNPYKNTYKKGVEGKK